MIIREANDSDAENIKRVVFSVLEEYGLEPDSSSTDKDLDSIDENYKNNGGYFGVIEIDSDIVAAVGIYKIDSDTCELRKMYALPSQRGMGLGRKLLEHSLAKAKELGFNRVVLETASPLVAAISLYKKYGFREYRPDHLSSRCDQAFELRI